MKNFNNIVHQFEASITKYPFMFVLGMTGATVVGFVLGDTLRIAIGW